MRVLNGLKGRGRNRFMRIARPLCGSLAAGLAALCMEYPGENPFDPNTNGGRDPFALVAVPDSGVVRIGWSRPDAVDVSKFLLYRATDADSTEFVLHRELKAGDATSHVDSLVSSDTTYYYRLSMIAGGEESHPSASVSAVPLVGPSPKLVVDAGIDTADTVEFGEDLGEILITIRNTGSRTLTIHELAATPASWLSFGNPADSSLAPGASRTLTIRVDRDSIVPRTEPYTGTATIVSDGGTWSRTVRAVAAPPELSVVLANEPVDTLDFDVNLSELLLTLKNSGGSALHIEAVTASPAKWIVPDSLGDSTIAASRATTLRVTVLRDSLTYRDARYYGSVSISSDGGDTSLVVSVLHKEDVARLAVDVDSLDFDSTESTLTLSVSNTGNTSMQYCSLTTVQEWISLDPSVIAGLGVGASRSVGITVDRAHASMAVGENTGLVHLNSDGGPADVKVRAYKKKPIEPHLELGADTVDFEDKYDVRTLVLRNSGTGSLKWTVSGISEKWFEVPGADSGSLHEDSSVEISVRAYRDSIADPGTYFATVNVLSAQGGDREFVVRVVKADEAAPEKSALAVDSIGATRVTLVWTRNTDTDFASYKVYRNDDSTVNDQDQLVHESGTVSDTACTRAGLTSLATYYYRVYTYDTDGRKSGSNFVKVTTTPLRTMSGRVYDRATGAPLAGVTAGIVGTSVQTTTGTDGAYEFLNPDTGSVVVRFAIGNYLTSGKRVTLTERGTVTAMDSLVGVPGVAETFTSPVGPVDVDLSVSGPRVVAAWTQNGGRLSVAYPASPTMSAVSSSWCGGAVTAITVLADDADAFVAVPENSEVVRIERYATSHLKRDTTVIIDSVVHKLHNPDRDSVEYLYTDTCLQNEAVSVIRAGGMLPRGLAMDERNLYVAGAAVTSGVIVAVIDKSTFTVTKELEIGDFPTRPQDAAIEVALHGEGLYLVSDASIEGRVLRLDLLSEQTTRVSTPVARLADVAVYDNTVYVCSRDAGADSVFTYSLSLERTGAIPMDPPGYRFAVCETGLYEGILAMTSPDGGTPRSVHFIDCESGLPAGGVTFEGKVDDFEWLSDGSGAVAAVAGQVHIVKP